MNRAKSFNVNKREVFRAWQQVVNNNGTYGVDNQTTQMYAIKLGDNLYKLWNRMSSGTYFPKEVRQVKIPKGNREVRILGIPTVEDRIAQTVVANILNKKIDKDFHEDSYGFRPNKSAHQALEVARQRNFRNAYVIDFDIKGLFDNIPHELIYKALEQYKLEKWVMLYISRWLEVSDKTQSGIGTPQGGVVSPILANVFMDICFDKWINKKYPNIEFERYADDCIVHCKTEKQALFILQMIEKRLNTCGLELNQTKTKIANTRYQKTEKVKNLRYDFLGYTFKPQKCFVRNKKAFVGFIPIISTKSQKKINNKLNEIKELEIYQLKIEEVAKVLNPKIRGWINYYGYFSKWSLNAIYRLIDNKIIKFLKKKYKSIRRYSKAYVILGKIKEEKPKLFYHWEIFITS